MTIRVLGVDENMEDMRKRLSEKTGLPAYIISRGEIVESDCRYREQHEAEYRKRNSLELCLAQLSSGNCVERIDYEESIKDNGEKIPAYSIRKFELFPARTLRFAIPMMTYKNFPEKIMKCVGMETESSGTSIRLSKNEIVPDELKIFVQDIKIAFKNSSPGIKFICSMPFMRPDVLQLKWHFDHIEPNYECGNVEYGNSGFTRIHAPGRYSFIKESSSDEAWNQMNVCSREPGPCVVCHGFSGEKNHLGVGRAVGLICKTCLPKAFSEWTRLINQFSVSQ